jgi:hypothetical protein
VSAVCMFSPAMLIVGTAIGCLYQFEHGKLVFRTDADPFAHPHTAPILCIERHGVGLLTIDSARRVCSWKVQRGRLTPVAVATM